MAGGVGEDAGGAAGLAALLAGRLDTVDPGFVVEDMILALFAAEPLAAEQTALANGEPLMLTWKAVTALAAVTVPVTVGSLVALVPVSRASRMVTSGGDVSGAVLK